MPDRRLRERDPPTLPPSPRGLALHGRQALKERQQSPWRLERRFSRTWSFRTPCSDVCLELPRLSGKSRQVHQVGNCLSNSAGLICPNVECLRCGLQSPSMYSTMPACPASRLNAAVHECRAMEHLVRQIGACRRRPEGRGNSGVRSCSRIRWRRTRKLARGLVIRLAACRTSASDSRFW